MMNQSQLKRFPQFWLFVFSIFFSSSLTAQIISVSPVFPSQDDTVTVIYDATQGSGGLVGVSPVHMHTGVITNLSTSPSDWKYVQTQWGTSDGLMEDIGNNKHRVKIHIKSYYGIPNGETVEKLAFVFRSQDGSQEGKTSSNGDIFYDVFDGSSYQAALLTPEVTQVLQPGDTLRIKGATSTVSTINFYLDDSLLTTTNGKELVHKVVPASGDYWLRMTANDGTNSREDSIFVLVASPTQDEDPPAGTEPGITYLTQDSLRLALYAPGKASVYMIGDLNDWKPMSAFQMKRSLDGSTFWMDLGGLTPGAEYAYQYLVDGDLFIADPYTEKVLDPWNDGFISNSVYPNLQPYPAKAQDIVSVLQPGKTPYVWQTNSWDRPAPGELVIYELLVRDFVAAHDYKTVIDSLDYLQNLGVNAIELMPIMEFEGNSSWGYNVSYFFAVDKYYGTENDLRAFIDSCHARGIVVILDMVLNHAFGQNSMVRLYWDKANNRPDPSSPWFNPIAKHPFNVGYDFNHESQATKYFSDRVLAHWLTEYRFDGFRMDLSKGFTQVNSLNNEALWNSFDNSRVNLLQRMFNQMRTVDSSAYFILEHLGGNTEETVLAQAGMMLWSKMTDPYNEATMGYHDNNKSNLDWTYFKTRGWTVPHNIAYMESHDEQRLMYKNEMFGNSSGTYDVRDVATGLARNEMAATFFFAIPGPKLMWQFGELGYEVDINFNGRTGEKPIKWNYFQEDARRRLYEVYAALIKLRQEHAVFQTDDVTLDVAGKVKTMQLKDSTMNVAIIGNFDVTTNSGVPGFAHTGMWYDFFSGDSVDVTDIAASVILDAGEYHLYTDVRLNTPPVNVSIDDELDYFALKLYPNPSQGQLWLSLDLMEAGELTIEVLDQTGRQLGNLMPSAWQAAGPHQWDLGRAMRGLELAPATYWVRLRQGNRVSVKPLLWLGE
ncbi:MAG: alpha-amylase family glycosyl hydrolase [Bacteroidota bacterium]